MKLWAKSVDSEIENTEVNCASKIGSHRNAYLLNLEREYNVGKSVRHLEQVKMYAELAGIEL